MRRRTLPSESPACLEELKANNQSAEIQAALSVNQQLLALYWELGKTIVKRLRTADWGEAIVVQLSKDLSGAFPDLKGFSRTNLYAMRQWYLFYGEAETVPQVVGQIPWGHNRLILDRIKDKTEAWFYAQACFEHGWSRNILAHQIDLKLYQRQGKAVTNFSHTLPATESEGVRQIADQPLNFVRVVPHLQCGTEKKGISNARLYTSALQLFSAKLNADERSAFCRTPESDLAQQTLKDPYIFDFLSIGNQTHEREVEKSLVDHITKFLLELGAGFAFLGRQYHLNVDGEDYYLDLLFYHVKLHCYVAIES